MYLFCYIKDVACVCVRFYLGEKNVWVRLFSSGAEAGREISGGWLCVILYIVFIFMMYTYIYLYLIQYIYVYQLRESAGLCVL